MIPSKEKKRLNIGVLGCGPIAQYAHLEACQKARNTNLYAICDVSRALRDRLQGFYDVEKSYGTLDEMLNDPKLDAVIVATSDSFHVPLAKEIIQAGKHVLIEKPLGLSVEECEELVALAKQTDVTAQVAHMKRFDPGISFAKGFVEEELGEMIALKAWYCDASTRYDATDSVHPITIRTGDMKKPDEHPKGDLRRYYKLAHGSHLVDTAYFLGGRIEAVRARLVEKEGIYNWFIDTKFENGTNGHLDLTVAIKGEWHEGFHIYGTQGTVFGKTFNPWYHLPSEVYAYSEKKKQSVQPIDAKANAYQLQLEGFADVVLHGKQMVGTSLEEGLSCVRTLVAIRESVETGDWVEISTASGRV